eukprot:7314-Heterococcus_DN1.PRE.6
MQHIRLLPQMYAVLSATTEQMLRAHAAGITSTIQSCAVISCHDHDVQRYYLKSIAQILKVHAACAPSMIEPCAVFNYHNHAVSIIYDRILCIEYTIETCALSNCYRAVLDRQVWVACVIAPRVLCSLIECTQRILPSHASYLIARDKHTTPPVLTHVSFGKQTC